MKKTFAVFVKAVLAGFCIGVGGNVFLALLPTSKPLGAFLFAVGLFTICTHGFNLFTGKACYILDNKPSYLGTLVVIWVGNLVGAFCMAALVHLTRLSGSYTEAAQGLVAAKNADSLGSLFVLGAMCNVLIYIAVDGYKSNPHEVGKYLALILGVAVFILAGTEHSVADMYYYAAAGELFTGNAILRLVIISLGNVVGGLIIPALKLVAKKCESEKTTV
ncbi:MAG: formate/nitrite transporter family protein [Ruminococcaceae bacterium]|jgi:formate/nitrite transporter FocA (FNT family)|nr:formate/nitrite transporter family protein [Oscillospiraceae bacterium]